MAAFWTSAEGSSLRAPWTTAVRMSFDWLARISGFCGAERKERRYAKNEYQRTVLQRPLEAKGRKDEQLPRR